MEIGEACRDLELAWTCRQHAADAAAAQVATLAAPHAPSRPRTGGTRGSKLPPTLTNRSSHWLELGAPSCQSAGREGAGRETEGGAHCDGDDAACLLASPPPVKGCVPAPQHSPACLLLVDGSDAHVAGGDQDAADSPISGRPGLQDAEQGKDAVGGRGAKGRPRKRPCSDCSAVSAARSPSLQS